MASSSSSASSRRAVDADAADFDSLDVRFEQLNQYFGELSESGGHEFSPVLVRYTTSELLAKCEDMDRVSLLLASEELRELAVARSLGVLGSSPSPLPSAGAASSSPPFESQASSAATPTKGPQFSMGPTSTAPASTAQVGQKRTRSDV